jgi:hypothetical protein
LTTSLTPHVRVPWHIARLVAPLIVDYFEYTARSGASARRAAHRVARHAARCTSHRRVLRLCRLSRDLLRLVTRLVAPLVTRLVAPLVIDYFDHATCPGAAARRAACRATRRATRRRLLRLLQATGCLGTSRGSSRGTSRRSSSTTPPRAGSSSTSSPTPRVRVPRHVTRLATRLVAPLVVEHFASCRLVVDYFAYAARLGASACHAAHHTACRAARRRLLQLRLASECLGTSRGSSRGSSRDSTTLRNYLKRLQDYSNCYSRLQCARGLVVHTPWVLMQGRMKTDSY